ncbi:MAG: ABC transporter permease [Prevotellaceae bacterium]|jgi:hypothetical protein|nr:ABC transporter permease [Prevotellaceae bacterium]
MLLWKLLRKNISIPQLTGYGVATLLGMSIVLLAIRFYTDVRPLFTSDSSLFKADFIVLSKKISLLNAVRSDKSAFTDKEIEDIRKQHFVNELSYFTPSSYQVYAYIDPTSNIPGFSTYMFFESVPDNLLDVQPKDWKWNEESRFIPIILPRSYLNLYNFGFAQSQGLPQISEGIISNFTLQVRLTGKGNRETFTSRIVGFTDRINTILVPDEFMRWANDRFGNAAKPKISRLIAEVKNPTDPAIAEYFAAKNLEINDDKGEQGKLSYFLKILVLSVSAVGLVIMVLAIALMLISINLLVYKNQKTFENLMLQGYRRQQLAKPYYLLTISINVIVLVLSLLIMVFVHNAYLSQLSVLKITAENSDTWTVIGLAVIFNILITGLNCAWINHKIRSIQIPKRR